MTIVDIKYTHHNACGCVYYEPGAVADEVPIIRGIDAGEVIDRIVAMRRQEDAGAYRIADYLCQSTASSPSGGDAGGVGVDIDIDGECRAKMAEWFYQLVEFCRVDRDNVAVAMSYLDRFLSAAHTGNDRARRCVSDRREYQLAAMTCLFIAINLAETREMDTGLLVELSHGKYTKADFVSMADAIMFGLDWRLNGPTSMGFVNHLLGLLPAEDPTKHVHDQPACCRQATRARAEATLHELCRTQTELAVSDYRLATCRPSDVAVAAVRNAMEQSHSGELLMFLRSLDAANIRPFSPEVEQARTILKEAFVSNVDGLRQVTSLLRLGEHGDEEGHASATRHSSLTESARCVGDVSRIQDRDMLRRDIGEGVTP